MDYLQRSWPFLGTKCVLCLHETCRACREISVSSLACCHCRARIVTKLAYLEKHSDTELPECARDHRRMALREA